MKLVQIFSVICLTVATSSVFAANTKLNRISSYSVCVKAQKEWVDGVGYDSKSFAKEVLAERVQLCSGLKGRSIDTRAAGNCETIAPAEIAMRCVDDFSDRYFGDIKECPRKAHVAARIADDQNPLDGLSIYVGTLTKCMNDREMK